jgi:hypothetical protein
MSYAKAIRNYWFVLAQSYLNPWRNRSLNRPFLVEPSDNPQGWLRVRTRVLRRDRYRCRGCDRKEGEVTIKIYPINPDASQVKDLVTLCISCRILARNFDLTGIDIPDFLRFLWKHLHHPIEPQHDQHQAPKMLKNDRLNAGSVSNASQAYPAALGH